MTKYGCTRCGYVGKLHICPNCEPIRNCLTREALLRASKTWKRTNYKRANWYKELAKRVEDEIDLEDTRKALKEAKKKGTKSLKQVTNYYDDNGNVVEGVPDFEGD